MNFGLSEEQEILQDTVDRFLDEACPITRVHEIFDADPVLDRDLWRGLMELGFGGLVIPEEYGGAGLGLVDLALTMEVLGRHAAPLPYLGHALAAIAIELGGSKAQKECWLPRIATGDSLATVAFAERGGFPEPRDWSASEKEGRLDGEKDFVLAGSEADLLVVGCSEGRLALVEGDAQGLKVTRFDGVDRSRPMDSLSLADVPCELLEGGTEVASRVRDAGLCLLAADAFGGASRALEMATLHATQREQFGVTLAHFQGIKHQLANLAAEIEPARGLYWFAAHAWDERPNERERVAALAKAHIAERFVDAAYGAAEVFGGVGFTWEGDIQIWLKRALFDRVYMGDTAHHRERAASLANW